MLNFANPLLSDFYEFIFDRHQIYVNREANHLPPPWTDDPALRTFRFCNVYRHLDKCTRYLIDAIINQPFDMETKLFNIVLFRHFNTNNFFNTVLSGAVDPRSFNAKYIEEELDRAAERKLKIFNPAYLVTGRRLVDPGYRPGYKQVQVILGLAELADNITHFSNALYEAQSPYDVVRHLTTLPHVGDFLAGQILLDLCYLKFFREPWTSNSFIVVGPGAASGIRLLEGKDFPDYKMQDFVCALRDAQPRMFEELKRKTGKDWLSISVKDNYPAEPYLSLMDTQAACCEWRKATNLRNGEGKRRYYDYGGSFEPNNDWLTRVGPLAASASGF